jgi:aspartate racemase
MKTIGLIGGMSWESSIEYYRIINEKVKEKAGGLHSAKSVMVSVDFYDMELLQREGRWDEATQEMIKTARQVEKGGADFLVICTNTMHKMADEVQNSISIPLLHIADATGEQITAAGLKKIGLLGTGFTMEEDFYKGRLARKHGLEVLVPEKAERDLVHKIIYEELVLGIIKPASQAAYSKVMEGLVARGAQGIILGCTEIGLLVKQEDSRVPLYDTTRIHAEAAVDFALKMT